MINVIATGKLLRTPRMIPKDCVFAWLVADGEPIALIGKTPATCAGLMRHRAGDSITVGSSRAIAGNFCGPPPGFNDSEIHYVILSIDYLFSAKTVEREAEAAE